MDTSQPLVGILMGSESDWPVMQGGARILKEFQVRGCLLTRGKQIVILNKKILTNEIRLNMG